MTVNTYSTENKKLSNFSVTVTDKEYQERLARAEVAIRQWIAFRQEWSKKPSRRQRGEGKTATWPS